MYDERLNRFMSYVANPKFPTLAADLVINIYKTPLCYSKI